MEVLIKFVGFVEYIDVSFIQFNLDDLFQRNHSLDAVRYIFGWQNKSV
jgi:hypothetical protein